MAYLCPHPCEGKTEYGYCRYTWCINPLHSNFGTAQQGQGVRRAVITNYDILRAKSVEEMAEFIANAVDCCNCKHPRNGCSENDETCAACWLDWLKQEAAE